MNLMVSFVCIDEGKFAASGVLYAKGLTAPVTIEQVETALLQIQDKVFTQYQEKIGHPPQAFLPMAVLPLEETPQAEEAPHEPE